MKLSEMKQLLADRGLRLTKSLGQNFLHDANQLHRIVAAAELAQNDRVLEIGPGLGPLTELLVARAGHVTAIEKDRRLFEILSQRFRETKNFQLIHADALHYLREEGADWSDWKVVSNLPYSVASPILVELAQAERPPERMVVTLQLEVARRLMAQPGEGDYGVLTLLVQLAYEPKPWFKIPPGCFFPEPDVDSACVTLMQRASPWLDAGQIEIFAAIVKRSFSQRRKMMFKLLKEDWPEDKLKEAFARLELSEQIRAEELGLTEFVKLTSLLQG